MQSGRYSPASLAVFGALKDPSEPEIAPPDVAAYEDVDLHQRPVSRLNGAGHAAL